MQGFRALADEFGLYLIEDCAQAHGAAVDGRSVGSFGDAAAFSFCTDKIMSTGGEGGMVITRDRDLRQRMWEYKDHVKSWDAVYNRDHSPGFKWLHESFGTNWRLTEMQSAIGRVQLQKLPEWVQKSRDNAQMLIDGLTGVQGLRVPVPEDHVSPSWYKFYAYVREERLRPGWDRDAIVQAVIDNGVPCMHGICCPEVYLEKAFDRRGLRPGKRLPAAKELGETSLIFLVHPTQGQREMEETVRVVREVVGEG